MSQSFIDEQLEDLRTSTQDLMMNPTVENVMQMMKENFEKVFNILTFIINGNALQHSLLLRLMEADSSQAIGTDLVQNYINAVTIKGSLPKQQQQEEEDKAVASISGSARDRSVSNQSSVSSRQSSASRQSTSEVSNEMICYDCGKVFVRGSLTDSISKHVKDTDCKPFPCPVCKKLFKDSSSRNKHAKTHAPQLKRTSNEVNDEPQAKRSKVTIVTKMEKSAKDESGSQDLFRTIKKTFEDDEESD